MNDPCTTARGDVYTYGKNDSGNLGHGHLVTVKKPLAIELLKYVRVVDGNRQHRLGSDGLCMIALWMFAMYRLVAITWAP
jgi:hypothetical protein